MISSDCPPGYVLEQAPLISDYVTCSCNYNNNLIIECDEGIILIEVYYRANVTEYMILPSHIPKPSAVVQTRSLEGLQTRLDLTIHTYIHT